jgi:dimethylamine/trimethylamine dehydrogenase
MGEEWRRRWHPESIAPKRSDDAVVVVGAGPAGLEAARALGQRGYAVTLAEATNEFGGRVTAEATLPGLSEWVRVRDYRVQQLQKMVNVEIYRASKLTATDVLSFGFPHVALATGSTWRTDGVGRWHQAPLANLGPRDRIFGPDDVLDGRIPQGATLVFDDDHYYMGSTIAERLCLEGLSVTLVTPAALVGAWSVYTAEQHRTQARLIDLGVDIVTNHVLTSFDGGEATLSCVFSGRTTGKSVQSLVLVTARLPDDALYRELASGPEALEAGGIKTLTRIGDCLAPGTIAAAVYSGHRYARELDEPNPGDVPYRRERVTL